MNRFQQFMSWVDGVKGRLWATVKLQPLQFVAALTMLLSLGWGIAAVNSNQTPAPPRAATTSGSTTSSGPVYTPLNSKPINIATAPDSGPSAEQQPPAPPVRLSLRRAPPPSQPFDLPTEPTSAGVTPQEAQTFLQGALPLPSVGGVDGFPPALTVAFDGGSPQVTALGAGGGAEGEGAAGGTPGGAGGGGGGTSPGGTVINPTNNITSPVPEPSGIALMLAGLGLLGWQARRRKAGEPDTRR